LRRGVAAWIYWSTVLAVGSATIYGVVQHAEDAGGSGGIGWFYALIWLPALFGGLTLGAVLGLLARALNSRPRTDRPQDESRPRFPAAALWTGVWCAGGFLVIAGAILLADRLARPAEVLGGSLYAVLPLLIPAIPLGLVSALGTVVVPRTLLTSPAAPARPDRMAMFGAGLGAALVGGVPLGLVPSATFSFAAAVPFGVGFPIAFVLLFLLAIGFTGFRLRSLHGR
ncbi:hypothetical protein BMH30_04415, partial [Leucobacter sp. OLES1]